MPITSKDGFKIKVVTYQTGRKRTRTESVESTPMSTTRGSVVVLNVPEASTASSSPDVILEDNSRPATTYRKLKTDEVDAWRSHEMELLKTRMEMNVSTSNLCSSCGATTSHLIRCQDCGPFVSYCHICERKAHSNVFHNAEIWEENKCRDPYIIGSGGDTCTASFHPQIDRQDFRMLCWLAIPLNFKQFTISPTTNPSKDEVFLPYSGEVKVLRRPNHTCNTSTSRSLLVVDNQGRLHSAVGLFCDCESHPSTLLRYGFWAATPSNPSVGFSLHLLDTLHLLTLECAVSVKGFVQMLRWKNNWSEIQFNRLYALLIGESISSYRTFNRHYEQHHLRHTSGISNAMKCPACPKGCGVTTISIDGNFGLVRKHNSGVSTRGTSTVESSFFMEDEMVETFVNSYQNDKQRDEECSTFKAGDAIRSGARNAKLDIRGVFGSVCRHEFPVLMANMRNSEKLAYPIYLIEQLRKTLGDTKLQVIYDIGCVLTRHLQRTKQSSIIDNVQIGLPIFHAYGHGASCQVQYSVRGLEGFGLTDGEGTERLWSFLRPLSKMTKEMTPTHRTELLNDALNQFCRRKIAGLATWLDMRVTRASDVQKEATRSLKEMTDLLQITDDQVRIWALEQKQQFVTPKPLSKSAITWETKYVTKLQCYYSLRNQILSSANSDLAIEVHQKMSDLDVSLRNTELSRSMKRWETDHPLYVDVVDTQSIASKTKILRQLHQDSSSRAFLVQLLSKYCDGQMIAIRLSKQVKKATSAVKKGVQLYNAVKGMKSGSRLHQTITEKDAFIPSSAIFLGVLDNQQVESLSVPASQRWKSVEHLMLCNRASEELGRIADDIRTTVDHYCLMHNALSKAIQSLSCSPERTLLKKRTLDMELIMQRIWQVAHKHLVKVEPMPSLNDPQISNQPAVNGTAVDTTMIEAYAVDSDCENDSDVDSC